MYEFWIYKKDDPDEPEEVIFGYSLKDAFRRNPEYNPDEWELLSYEYID